MKRWLQKMNQPKVLITGGTGQLGTALREHYPDAIYPTRKELDLLAPDVTEKIKTINPDIIINTAAIVGKVDLAEDHPEESILVNALAVHKMLQGMSDPSNFVQISSDYVRADNIYGLTKKMAESMVLRKNGLVIRTSWLFGGQKNWVTWTLENAHKPLTIVNDQIGRPTYVKDLARAIKEAEGQHGLLEIQNTGLPVSWFEYAMTVCKLADKECDFMPVTSEFYQELHPEVAPRPRDSVFPDYEMPDWMDSLREYLSESS